MTFTGIAYTFFKANSSITQGGATLNLNRLYVNGTGITATMASALSIGATSLYLTNGTFTTANLNLTSTGSLVTETGTKTLTLGSSVFNIGTWNNAAATNFTFNYNTSTVNITASGTLTGANTFYNLTITGAAAITAQISGTGNQTVTNTLTITGANATSQRVLIQSNTIGTPRSLTFDPSKAVISNADFQDINCPNAIDLSTNYTVGNCGGNTGITFCPSLDLYIKHTSGAMSVSNTSKWVLADMTTAGRVPLPHDRSWGISASFTGASTLTCDVPRIGSIDLSGVDKPVTWALGNAISCFGNYVLGVNITQNGNFLLSLRGRSTYNLNLFGNSIYGVGVYPYGGRYNNQGVFTQNNVGSAIDCQLGIFDINDFNITCKALIVNTGSSVYLGDGVISIDILSGPGFYYVSGNVISENSTVKFNPLSSVSNISFIGGGKTYNIVQFSGSHTGNFDITGSNAFNKIIIDKGRKVRFTAGTTQTISGQFDATGTQAEPITISGVTAAPFTLNYTGTSFIQCDWLNLTNCVVSNVGKWFAGKNSVNNGGNTGWLFRRYIMTPIISLIRRI
jgi:hypothetical protein